MTDMSDRNRVKIIIVILILIIGLTFICGCSKREISPTPATFQTTSPTASSTQSTSSQAPALSQVKVASVYERVSDGVAIGRSTSETVNIFKDTNTDLIFRGFFRWEPVPESPGASMPGYSSSYVSGKANIGYTYKQLGDAISQIKAAKPDTLFVGAIAAQRLNKIERNDETQESLTQSQTWAMALDPTKFNLGGSKEELQCKAAQSLGWIESSTNCPSGYDPATAPAYFPDITNEQYQDLLVSWAEKQIDLGADGIWIDMLFGQANYIQQTSQNPNDPAIKASYDASSKVIDKIHDYGKTKYGKHIYVGTWWTFTQSSYSPATQPALDFVTVATPADEIKSSLNEGNWNTIKSTISGKLGNIPIYVFIDWNGGANGPMGVFSQSLTPAQQRAWLESANAFFTKKGIIFAYPVHGGTFPMSSKSLAFGKYNVYDSLAPQFETYDTIKNLAKKKSES
jgi:hypothetical protein